MVFYRLSALVNRSIASRTLCLKNKRFSYVMCLFRPIISITHSIIFVRLKKNSFISVSFFTPAFSLRPSFIEERYSSWSCGAVLQYSARCAHFLSVLFIVKKHT